MFEIAIDRRPARAQRNRDAERLGQLAVQQRVDRGIRQRRIERARQLWSLASGVEHRVTVIRAQVQLVDPAAKVVRIGSDHRRERGKTALATPFLGCLCGDGHVARPRVPQQRPQGSIEAQVGHPRDCRRRRMGAARLAQQIEQLVPDPRA